MAFVIISISSFIMSSHRYFRILPKDDAWKTMMHLYDGEEYVNDVYDEYSVYRDAAENVTHAGHDHESALYDRYSQSHPVLEIINLVCASFFSIELLTRIIFSPNKIKFFISPLTIIDIIALVPFYVEITVNIVNPKEIFKESFIDAMHILQLARIFRIFRMVKHYWGLHVIFYSIRSSIREICLLVVLLFMGVVVFATLAYYADNHNGRNSEIKDVTLGMWWALVTMTTVGYGDVVPSTGFGYMIGSFCALSGVIVIALTIPVVVSNFMMYYSHARSRQKRSKRYKRKKKQKHTEISNGGSSTSECVVTVNNASDGRSRSRVAFQ